MDSPESSGGTDNIPSSVDAVRVEMKWDVRQQNTLLAWAADAKKRSNYHGEQAVINKARHAAFGVPTMVLPLVISTLTDYLRDLPVVSAFMLITCALFSTIATFFAFAGKMQHHGEFESRFAEFATTVEAEMSKPRAHRTQCDVYLQKSLDSYNSLVSSAPM